MQLCGGASCRHHGDIRAATTILLHKHGQRTMAWDTAAAAADRGISGLWFLTFTGSKALNKGLRQPLRFASQTLLFGAGNCHQAGRPTYG